MKTLFMKETSENENIPAFCKRLNDAMKRDMEVVLDFSGISNIETSTMKWIVKTGMQYKNKGNVLKLRNFSESIRAQFMMMGLCTRDEEIDII